MDEKKKLSRQKVRERSLARDKVKQADEMSKRTQLFQRESKKVDFENVFKDIHTELDKYYEPEPEIPLLNQSIGTTQLLPSISTGLLGIGLGALVGSLVSGLIVHELDS